MKCIARFGKMASPVHEPVEEEDGADAETEKEVVLVFSSSDSEFRSPRPSIVM